MQMFMVKLARKGTSYTASPKFTNPGNFSPPRSSYRSRKILIQTHLDTEAPQYLAGASKEEWKPRGAGVLARI